jgi:hypothetical protein
MGGDHQAKIGTIFAQGLRRFMRSHRSGPMSVVELARVSRLPRSTIHRHLAGGAPSRESLVAYSRALGVAYEELARLAGVAHDAGQEAKAEAITLELKNLDPQALELVWDLVEGLRKRHGNPPPEEDRRSLAIHVNRVALPAYSLIS